MAPAHFYLIDKSAWEQRRYSAAAKQRISDLRHSGRLAICIITLAEILYSARNADEFETDHAHLNELQFLPMTRPAEDQVVASMQDLARKGQHRRAIPDLLIAAIAKVHGATVLHYDRDFEIIAEATGQRHEWIVPRGTGHRAG